MLSKWLRGLYGDSAIPAEEELKSAMIEYSIEVKATSGKANEPFHISDWQFEEAKKMSSFPRSTSIDKDRGQWVAMSVFLVSRVSGVGGSSPTIEVITKLWSEYAEGKLVLRAPAGLVIVRK